MQTLPFPLVVGVMFLELLNNEVLFHSVIFQLCFRVALVLCCRLDKARLLETLAVS